MRVCLSLLISIFAAHLQHAHADGLFNNGLHFRRLSKFGIQAINKENPFNSSSHTDFIVNIVLLFWLLNHHILCSTFYKCIPIKRTEVVCVDELFSYWLALLISASVVC